jgi:enoyl-CoA hydratase
MFEREMRGEVAVLRLAHGKVNAIDVELMEELEAELTAVEHSAARALVLTGRGGSFSAGVDLFRVAEEGRFYLERFLPALSRALGRLFTFPRPVVAAANGHAIAGGAILAFACDHRILAEGPARFGVPELLVGVPFPCLPLEIVRFAVPRHRLQEIVYGGRNYTVEEALEGGLVDETAPAEALLDRACAAAERLAAIPSDAFRLTKAALRGPTMERVARDAPEHDAAALDIWAAPEAAVAIRAFLERTIGKRR